MLIDGTKIKQDEQTAPTLGAAGGGTLNASTGSTTLQGQSAKGGKPSSSGQFTNLKNYLNSGAKQTIDTVKNKVFDPQINEANSAFQSAVNQGLESSRSLADAKSNQDFIKSAFDSPETTDFNRFNNLRKNFNVDPYSHVQNFQNTVAPTQAKINQASQNLQNFSTDGGLTDALGQIRQNKNYTQGSKALDRFIIKGTEEGQNAIQGVVDQGKALAKEPSFFENLTQKLQTKANEIDPNFTTAQQIQAEANRRLQQYRQSEIDPVMELLRNPQRSLGTDTDSLDGITDGIIDKGGQYATLSNTDSSTSKPLIKRGLADTQIARLRALGQLSGEDVNPIIEENIRLSELEEAKQNQLIENSRARALSMLSERNEAMRQAELERLRKEEIDRNNANLLVALTLGPLAAKYINSMGPGTLQEQVVRNTNPTTAAQAGAAYYGAGAAGYPVPPIV